MYIKELSDQTGASIRSLRHYESKGLLHSERLPNGYRNYDNEAIATVKTIQLYLSLGLTTEAIVRIIGCPVSPPNHHPICQEAYALYTQKCEQVKSQIQLLRQIQSQLEAKMNEFEQAAVKKQTAEPRR